MFTKESLSLVFLQAQFVHSSISLEENMKYYILRKVHRIIFQFMVLRNGACLGPCLAVIYTILDIIFGNYDVEFFIFLKSHTCAYD